MVRLCMEGTEGWRSGIGRAERGGGWGFLGGVLGWGAWVGL